MVFEFFERKTCFFLSILYENAKLPSIQLKQTHILVN
jgi:hypothetical protein